MRNRFIVAIGDYLFFVLSIIVFVLSSKIISSLPAVFDDGEGLGLRVFVLGWAFYVVAGFAVAFVSTVLYVVTRVLFGGKVLVASIILPVTVVGLWLCVVLSIDLAGEGMSLFVDKFFVTGIVAGSCIGGLFYYSISGRK